MIKIKTDNDKAKLIVTQLVDLIADQGGFVHPHLQLVISNSEMTLSYSKRIDSDEPVIILPLHIMPVLSHFNYSLAEQSLKATVISSVGVSSEQVEAMSLSVELYNLFSKVEEYSKSSPPLQLSEHPNLLKKLLTGGNAEAFSAKNFSTKDDQKIFCYWHTRAYYDFQTGTDRMLPFLEFVDHHAFADGFRAGYSHLAGDILELRHTSVIKGQVLACYAAIDALECYVKYGFFDSSAFFIKSQPFMVELPGAGKVKVESRGATVFQLPQEEWYGQPRYSNSLFYTPRVFCEKEGATISYSLIPPKRHIPAFDEALQQQMIQLEQGLSLAVGTLNNADVIRLFKQALCKHNKYFLQQLVSLVKDANLAKSAPTTIGLFATLQHQRKLLQAFEKYGL